LLCVAVTWWAFLPNCGTTELRTTERRNCGTAELRNDGTAELQNVGTISLVLWFDGSVV
jgi:hypothetical protein